PPVPAINVSDCVLSAAPSTAPSTEIVPPAAVPPLLVVSSFDNVPASVTALVEEPIEIVLPEVRTCPFNVTAGAVAVTPPVKSSVSAALSPNVTVPVLLNVTALVITALPVIETL